MLGQDLSARGLRVRGQLPVEIGTNLNVILYGAAREEPMVVAATVVRREDDEIALRFDRVSRELKKKIELLSRSLPALERLDGPDGEDRRVVVSELTSAG